MTAPLISLATAQERVRLGLRRESHWLALSLALVAAGCTLGLLIARPPSSVAQAWAAGAGVLLLVAALIVLLPALMGEE